MHEFPTPRAIAATIQLAAGDIVVHASDRTDTTVEVLPAYAQNAADLAAVEQTTVEYVGGTLTIIGAKGRGIGMLRKPGSVRVIVSLPTGSAVDARSGIGRISSTGVLGPCLVRNGAGDVAVEDAASLDAYTGVGDVTAGDIAGDTKIKTGSGDLRVASVGGSTHLRTANGDTRIGDARGAVSVKSSNGRIAIGHAHSDTRLASSNGDLTIGAVESGTVALNTALGRVEVGVVDGVAARLDVHTSYGNVITELAPTGEPAASDGSVQITARTSAGDIVISRAPDGVAA